MSDPAPPEHIFPATSITKAAIRWKDAVAEGREREAAELLEEIVIGSEPMFRRFAAHMGFDRTVDIERLVSVAQEKVVKWLLAWKPDKPIFSFFTACAKNAYRSEVNKENVFRRRHHVTSDNLEKFFGQEEHGVEIAESARTVRERVASISSRWGSRQEIGTLRYLIECVMDTPHDRVQCQRAAAWAWGLSPDMVKFFYNWVLMEMRSVFYDRVRLPFTEQDLLRHAHTYDHLVDMLNIVSFEQLKKLIAVMGGTRIHIPTTSQMAKLAENYAIWKDIEESDMDPASVEAVGRKYKRSGKSAQEIYTEMCDTLHEDRSGEYSIFDADPEEFSFEDSPPSDDSDAHSD